MLSAQWFTGWILVIVATTLAGWWLTIRPRACYRGVSAPISFLIFVAASLMFLLAISGQGGHRTHVIAPGQAVALSR